MVLSTLYDIVFYSLLFVFYYFIIRVYQTYFGDDLVISVSLKDDGMGDISWSIRHGIRDIKDSYKITIDPSGVRVGKNDVEVQSTPTLNISERQKRRAQRAKQVSGGDVGINSEINPYHALAAVGGVVQNLLSSVEQIEQNNGSDTFFRQDSPTGRKEKPTLQ